ncbi:ArsA family ATPase, partial [Streptomyces sp. NPDC004232]
GSSQSPASSPAPEAASGTPASEEGSPADAERAVDRLTAGLLRLHADRMQLLARERRTRGRFTARHPEVAVVEVPALPGDVHDLTGLRDIGTRLAAGARGAEGER